MNLLVEYDSVSQRVVLRATREDATAEWFLALRRALEDYTDDVDSASAGSLSAPWWSFVQSRTSIGSLLSANGIIVSYSDEARHLLERARDRAKTFDDAARAELLSEELLIERLRSQGFTRSLTPEQTRNVRKLAALPAGATFSVPGAGKTTESLAYYFARITQAEHLIVIAPKNAFSAWDEQMAACVQNKHGQFVRLRGGRETIGKALSTKPRFMVITYQQLARVADLIASFVSANDCFVFLDESHKIKSGRGRVTADAILSLSHLPVGKLIMSGTPMPQAAEDLVPQLAFLYPEVRISGDAVIEHIQPIFVRTTKAELKLPPVTRRVICVPLNDTQRRLYNLMSSEVARQAEATLSRSNRQALRLLGRSVIRILQVVSNPALLAREIRFVHEDLLSEVLAEGDGPKIRFACLRARQLAKGGRKTLIWTTFRENVELIADRLRDLGAVFIHGGVDAGLDDDDDTREGKIKLFHDDPNCFVMVANPAAASEGISLHKVCHHAIYVDRTYNAAHYLQSEDRIHRLGLEADEAPTIELLEGENSIDQSVRARLELKVQKMADALNDPSLNIDPIPFDPYDTDDTPEGDAAILDLDDVRSILETLRAARL